MPTDSYFTQGSTHRICQDYAAHGADYAIVSDGCSGSVDSDFGSRLLTRAAIPAMANYEIGTEQFYRAVLQQAIAYAEAIGLNVDCLFATLLIAQQKEKEFIASIHGDGIIVAKYPNYLYVRSLEFLTKEKESAPLYLRYFLSNESLEDFKNRVGTTYIRHEYIITESQGKPLVTETSTECQIDFSRPGVEVLRFDQSEVQSVAIMSDGVSAFLRIDQTETRKQAVRVDFVEIVKEVMAFRNYNNGFVQRRCQMAFKKFDKAGWKPADDFSVGVVVK